MLFVVPTGSNMKEASGDVNKRLYFSQFFCPPQETKAVSPLRYVGKDKAHDGTVSQVSKALSSNGVHKTLNELLPFTLILSFILSNPRSNGFICLVSLIAVHKLTPS